MVSGLQARVPDRGVKQAVQKVGPFAGSWQGGLRDLANVVHHVKRLRLSGRLSLRNTERLSIAHLYFRLGKLVHVVGNRGDARAILEELRQWRYGFVRFDRNVLVEVMTLGDEHERLLEDTLLSLNRDGMIVMPPKTRVIESNVIINVEAKQLITPREWQVLVEGTRRVSLAVAHLVGPQEALSVLRDILDDCSAAFPAFTSLKIATSGYLQIMDSSQLDHLSREDLLEGFTALIATCQYFCSPIIGEKEAHRLMISALREIGPALVSLGVFHIDGLLLRS